MKASQQHRNPSFDMLSRCPIFSGWSDWKVLDWKTDDYDMMVSAEYTKPPACCLKCSVEGAKLLKHGVQEQTFMDTPIHGKRVGIRVHRQRYRCADCNGTFQEFLPDMDEKRTMTKRLLDYIRTRSLERTFTEVSHDVGVNEKTVRNIFTDYVDELDRNRKIATPEWLGIDELFLIGKPRCMLTNIQEKSIVDILPNRDKKTVTMWLDQIPDRETVEVVTMDMWRPYRDAVNATLPKAVVVVDKFHVVKMANYCMDTVRKSLREGMDAKQRRRLMHDRHLLLRRRKDLEPMDFMMMESWTNSLPALFSAYQAKEDFFEVYEKCTSRKDATELYDIWRDSLDPKTKKAFHELIRAVDNWKPEVFAFFDHGATNAYTEAVNGLTKVVNRVGRGYSFHAIRAKMLFGHPKRRPVFAGPADARGCLSKIDFGVDIQQLTGDLVGDFHNVKSTPKSE